MMRFERYRRMKIVGMVFIMIGVFIPMTLILLLKLGMRAVVPWIEWIGLGNIQVLAAVFIAGGIVLWAAGWIMEGN